MAKSTKKTEKNEEIQVHDNHVSDVITTSSSENSHDNHVTDTSNIGNTSIAMHSYEKLDDSCGRTRLSSLNMSDLLVYLEAVDALYVYYDNNVRCEIGNYGMEFTNRNKDLLKKYGKIKNMLYKEMENRINHVDFNS